MKSSKSQNNEVILLFGHLTSKMGDLIFDYANKIVLVSAFTAMPWVLALYQSMESIVGIIFNIIGGLIADFGNKKKIIIISDLLSATVCFITSFFISSNYMAAALIIANGFLALIFSFQSPCFRAVISQMIEKDRIVKYNSINNAGMEIINITGPIIGLALMGYVGARGALLINAGSFFISAVSEVFLQPLKPEVAKSKKPSLKELPSGIIYVYKNKTILIQVISCAFVNFFIAAYNLLAPYTEIIYKETYNGYYSKLLVADAIGGILGSIVNTKIADKYIKNGASLLKLSISEGISLMLIPIAALSGNLFIGLIPYLLFSMTLAMYNINFMSYVQTNVDEAFQGRVFSVIFAFIMIFMPIGSFFFSAIKITEDIRNFYIPGVGIIIVAIACLIVNKYMNEGGAEA